VFFGELAEYLFVIQQLVQEQPAAGAMEQQASSS
jgi:hypothetical protein